MSSAPPAVVVVETQGPAVVFQDTTPDSVIVVEPEVTTVVVDIEPPPTVIDVGMISIKGESGAPGAQGPPGDTSWDVGANGITYDNGGRAEIVSTGEQLRLSNGSTYLPIKLDPDGTVNYGANWPDPPKKHRFMIGRSGSSYGDALVIQNAGSGASLALQPISAGNLYITNEAGQPGALTIGAISSPQDGTNFANLYGGWYLTPSPAAPAQGSGGGVDSNRLGIGKAPTANLDVLGNGALSADLAVGGQLSLGATYLTRYSSGGTLDALKIVNGGAGATLGIQNSQGNGFSGIEYMDVNGNTQVFTGYNNSAPGEFRFHNIAGASASIKFMINGNNFLEINPNRIYLNQQTECAYIVGLQGGSMNGYRLNNVADPVAATDASTKQYADAKWTRWSGTQAAYDAIAVKDPNTLYVVKG